MDKHTVKLQTWPFGGIESSLVQVQLKKGWERNGLLVSDRAGSAHGAAGAAESPTLGAVGLWGCPCSPALQTQPGASWQHLPGPALTPVQAGHLCPLGGLRSPRGTLQSCCRSSPPAGPGEQQGQRSVTSATLGHRFWRAHCTSFRPTRYLPSPRGKGKESGCEPVTSCSQL